jgi:hypothetical protein
LGERRRRIVMLPLPIASVEPHKETAMLDDSDLGAFEKSVPVATWLRIAEGWETRVLVDHRQFGGAPS